MKLLIFLPTILLIPILGRAQANRDVVFVTADPFQCSTSKLYYNRVNHKLWGNSGVASGCSLVSGVGSGGGGGGGGDALTSNPLSQFAATTSAQLASVITDETGAGGVLVFNSAPVLLTPVISSFTNANHNHSSGPTGGQLTDAALSAPVGTGKGGTGATTASDARTNLGLVIGTDIQAFDPDLSILASLLPTTNNFIVSVGGAWASVAPSTAAGLLTGKVNTGAVTTSGLTMNPARILGRTTGSVGAIEEVSVGTGLSLSGGSLTATGVPGGSDTQCQRNNAGAFGGISGCTSNGTSVTFTNSNLLATSPRFTTSIKDANGNDVMGLTATGAAVNNFNNANAATGNGPTLSAVGSDTDIDINLTPKGAGAVKVTGSTSGSVALSGSTSGTVTVSVANAAGTHTIKLPTADGTNGQCLQTNGSGQWSWGTCGSSGANTALSNLASVAVNLSLLAGADNSIDLGSASFQWRTAYLGTSAVSPLFQSKAADPADAGVVRLGNNELIAWENATPGTDLSLKVNNSNQFEFTGTGAAQITTTQTTAPTCSSNCGTSPSVTGTDTAMTVTMGATGSPASAFVVTFNSTWAAAPSCVGVSALSSMVTGKKPIALVTTTTTLTVTTDGTAPANSDKYFFHCIGVQ